MIKTSNWTAQEDGPLFDEQYLLDMLLHELSTDVTTGSENISSNISKKLASPSSNDSGKQNYMDFPAPCPYASRNLLKIMNGASSKEPEVILNTSYRAIFNKAIGPTAYM
jgi:hypothetical protein